MADRIKQYKPYLATDMINYVSTDKYHRKVFYSSARWRRFRQYFLCRNPFCVDCQAAGREGVVATHVDHQQEIKDAPHLAFVESNVKAKCASCHNRKTASSANKRR
jgi:5-methylcytosine-specific restriction endonuclease McrA